MSDDGLNPGWVPAYSPNQFTTLCEEIDRQGGALLPDVCEPDIIKYPRPQSDKVDLATTCFCDNASMAAIPYDPASTAKKRREMAERGAGFARVCLVCDAVGLWPGYVEALDGVE